MEDYSNRDNKDSDDGEDPIDEIYKDLRDLGVRVHKDKRFSEKPLEEMDLNELYREEIRQAYDAAFETIQDYLEALRNPYQEIERVLREYDDPEEIDIILNHMSQVRQLDMERQLEFATAMLEYAQSLNEMYIENRKEDIEFKIGYLDMFGAEGFDVDPEEGPIWEQITREDILDHFYDNYVNKN